MKECKDFFGCGWFYCNVFYDFWKKVVDCGKVFDDNKNIEYLYYGKDLV